MAEELYGEERNTEPEREAGGTQPKAPSVITVFTAQFVAITAVFAVVAALIFAGLFTSLQQEDG